MAWSKKRALEKIREVGLIPIVRAPTAEIALAAAEAIVESGVGVAEITMTVPNALVVLREVARRFGSRALIGAGTILDAKTCARAIAAGAEFIASPSFYLPFGRAPLKGKKVIIPSVTNPTQILVSDLARTDLIQLYLTGTLAS